ncbi:Vi polysaccharide biosynthesis UDP-N-acetylglucosamine C-6 dehydrogenase TviB [Aliagarivorans marinus]|uniref:Vi polysaccharide biosynthesis UDP-N-acetylglucosamine C-6 dehydrogenase TviB n=1 Tax=Aliagarivorans marinus TaxID=561965 RepID=UPI00041DE38F|nr:Vi polysaccharide biosynthesis UDP-N-acetylglucosamine C-6 dehydrogenase TviB [Aliagarivorans marinus]
MSRKIAVIGLGYVGLPLAVEFAKHQKVIGFDIVPSRVQELKDGIDSTQEVSSDELALVSRNIRFATRLEEIVDADVYIITVPTPITQSKQPDLSPLLTASESVAQVLSSGDIVIYESTVYPGTTEEQCVPVLEKISGLNFNKDFFVGYSPERINPGDKERRVSNITKITSGSTAEIADIVDRLYKQVVTTGTHKASSIKVAEAAKVIENTQRDVNIALMNELAIIFNRLDIDTEAVLKAAGTKWNFLPFRPGLVGGHCIGVDPYYLTYKAKSMGYRPEIISAGRRVNSGMGSYVVGRSIKVMVQRNLIGDNCRVLVLGFTFKENCPDVRNTRVIDIVEGFAEYNVAVDVYDPWADSKECIDEYGIELIKQPKQASYDLIILAVAHEQFKQLGAEKIHALGKSEHIVYDLKYLLEPGQSDLRL